MKAQVNIYLEKKLKSKDELFGSLGLFPAFRVCCWKNFDPYRLAAYFLKKDMHMRSRMAYNNAKSMSQEEINEFLERNSEALENQIKRLSTT